MTSLPDTPAIPMKDDRIWVDGCFDFSHHGDYAFPTAKDTVDTYMYKLGHAGAMLQAKQLGNYLVVGVHTDEEIMENKG